MARKSNEIKIIWHEPAEKQTSENVQQAVDDLYMVTSKNPQKYRPIEAFSIIGQILTCKQCFEKVTLP